MEKCVCVSHYRIIVNIYIVLSFLTHRGRGTEVMDGDGRKAESLVGDVHTGQVDLAPKWKITCARGTHRVIPPTCGRCDSEYTDGLRDTPKHVITIRSLFQPEKSIFICETC